jgi:Dolichyl-phosphate-mannose-protein mannosyltransferase
LSRPSFSSLGTWLWKRRDVLLFTLAALAVRLVWNLRIHPPTDFAYSDMGGYLDRANQMIDKPGVTGPWLTLFPYGTHFFIFALKRAFGRDNTSAIGAGYAVLGTLAVAYTYATAERFIPRRWARRLVGLILVVYYPWISLGGYALSETPFALCVAASTFYALRLADLGRRGDAWWLGLWLGLGAAVRPQILVAVVFLAVHFVFRRRAWKHFTPGLGVRAAVPFALILGFSAYRVHVHTEKWGLVSTNGPLNAVFGRCHNTGLEAVVPGSRGFFGPPAFGSLFQYGKEHKDALFTLDPILGEKLTIQGHMWDTEPNYKLAASCVRKTGLLKQARYALTHVVLLWGYNIIWPDQGQKPRWREPMAISQVAHNVVVLPAAAVALLLAFRRRRARAMVLALQVWSLFVTSMLYFGDTRYRAPYDGVLIVLAAATYLDVRRLPRRAWDRLYDLGYRLRWGTR